MQNTLEKLIKNVNQIENLELKNAIINHFSTVMQYSQVADADAVEIALTTKKIIEFIGQPNAKYLAKTMKWLVQTESVALKDKAFDLLDMFMGDEKYNGFFNK